MQPIGKTLRYLLFLALIVTFVVGLRSGVLVSKFMKNILDWAEENSPLIEINKGVVIADIEQPYIITKENFAMIIDTTGQITAIDEKYPAGMFLGKDKFVIKHDEIRSQEFDLKKIDHFVLDREKFAKWKKYLLFALVPFMFVMQFVYFFMAKISQSALSALILLIVRPLFKFTQIMNLCIYALTPVTVLSLFVMLITPRPLLFFPIIYIGMYIAFLVGALNQCRTEPPEVKI
jgi:hypothetical protein